jgi:hypothetical protein
LFSPSGISVEEAAEAGVEAVMPEPLSFTAVSALSTQDLGQYQLTLEQ